VSALSPIVEVHDGAGDSGRPTSREVLRLYESGLLRAAAGHPVTLTLRDDRGRLYPVDLASWSRPGLPGDAGLLDRCTGPTLDVGCGPGRLAGDLLARGTPALGIDVSAVAVGLAVRRGVPALRRDVFDPLPGHGRWRHILLADGNIGIGGAPRRLLRRCRDLLAPGGSLHVECAAPGTRTWAGVAALAATPAARPGDAGSWNGAWIPFRWASVAAGDLPRLAVDAGLRVVEIWTEATRWFATLARA
jgi:SAM-dependent methyltransferase